MNVVLRTAVVGKRKPERISFGDRLRHLRRDRRLTQKQLAERLGTDASSLARLETGKIRDPGLERVRQIADALDVPVSLLLGEAISDSDIEDAIKRSDLTEENKRLLIRVLKSLEPK